MSDVGGALQEPGAGVGVELATLRLTAWMCLESSHSTPTYIYMYLAMNTSQGYLT